MVSFSVIVFSAYDFFPRREFLIFIFTFGFFARQIFKYWRCKRSALVRVSLGVLNFLFFSTLIFSNFIFEGEKIVDVKFALW
jgi:hypothetical protein